MHNLIASSRVDFPESLAPTRIFILSLGMKEKSLNFLYPLMCTLVIKVAPLRLIVMRKIW